MTESGSLKLIDTSTLETVTITSSKLQTYCVDLLKTQKPVEIQSKNMPVENVCKTEKNLVESSILMDKEMDSVPLSKDISLANYIFESIIEVEADSLAEKRIEKNSLKSNENLNKRISKKIAS